MQTVEDMFGLSVCPRSPSALAEASDSWLDLYFSYRGRISRFDYWIRGILVGFALGLLVGGLDAALQLQGGLSAIVTLFSLWPGSAILVKRWHDRNKSGWYYFILFIPLVGVIWTFIEAGCLPGTTGANRYGPQPRSN